MTRASNRALLGLAALLLAGGLASAQAVVEGFGVPIFPGAKARPDVARAIEAYYTPGIEKGQTLTAGVFETSTGLDEVSDFYGPRMGEGKFGWRKKTKVLLHQTETLKFLRAQLLAQRGRKGKELTETFEPLFGDLDLSQEEFEKKVDKLLAKNRDARVQIVEGSRTIAGDPARSQVRISVERPYIDLKRMKLVDKTRILLVKVSPGG